MNKNVNGPVFLGHLVFGKKQLEKNGGRLKGFDDVKRVLVDREIERKR